VPSEARVNRRAVRQLQDARRRTARRATALATACVVLVALVLYGAPVPRLSEELYLPLARHVGDPSFLAGDWTMRGAFGEHWVFNHAFGPLAAAIPLSLFGWLGRIVAWTVLAWLLVRLGGRIGLPPLAAAAAVTLWLLANQALIGGDWMFGTFEAKTVADVLVVAALLAATRERVPLAIALFGAGAALHPGLGGWAAFAGGAALLANPSTRARALRWAVAGVVLAAPGLVAVLTSVGAASALDRFLVIVALPYHLDPYFGGAQLAGVQVALRAGVLVGMLAMNVVWFRRSDRGPAQQFLVSFQLMAFIPVVIAFVGRVLEAWQFLVLQPMRVGPLVIPLVFFLQLVLRVRELAARAADRPWWRRRATVLAVFGVGLALTVTSPLLAAPRMVQRTVRAWTGTDDDADALTWISGHTPASTRCVVPVDRQDAYERAERPVVATWQAIRYDDLAGWKRRIDALVGGATFFGAEDRAVDLVELRRAYDALGARQIVAVARRYRADCIVSTSRYPLPVLHRSGKTRIYRVPAHAGP
jgi:hypothetical protein